MKITNKIQFLWGMKELEKLIENDPSPRSKKGKELRTLALAIQKYENGLRLKINISPRLRRLRALENENHNLNRKIRKIVNSYAWVVNNEHNLELRHYTFLKEQTTRRIHIIKSQLMGAK